MKLLLAFFSCFLVLGINAQNPIVLEQDSISQTYTNVDISDNEEKFPLDLYFKNNTNTSIAVNWRREFSDNCPAEWDVLTADHIISYLPHVNESQQAIPLMQGDSNILVRQIFFPRSFNGCCDIKMIFSLEGAPDVPIDTGYYQIEINAAGCLSSTRVVEQEAQPKIYPNPTSGTLNLENIESFESIEIFDLAGRMRYQNKASLSNSIDISRFSSGAYICKFRDASGSILSQKVVVH